MKYFIVLFQIIIIISSIYCNTLNDIIDKSVRFNDWKKAKSDLESYLNQNPIDAKGYSIYAEILAQIDLYDDAIIAVRKAINYELSDEKKGVYYYNLGFYYYSKNLNNLALQMYDKSLSLNNTIDSNYYMKGLINYEDKNIQGALDNWKKYVSQTKNIEKKVKVEEIIRKFEQMIQDEKIKKEEEKKKQEELMKKLLEELSEEEKKSKSLEADKNKIKDRKNQLEEIEE